MSQSTPDKRPWWAKTRIQGMLIMGAGVAMLFCPVTAPHAGTIISVGAGWALGGGNAKLTRDHLNKQP